MNTKYMNHLKSLAYKVPFNNNDTKDNNECNKKDKNKHHYNFCIVWDAILFIATYFSCLLTPICIGIMQDNNLSNPVTIILLLLDIIFIIDLSLIKIKR